MPTPQVFHAFFTSLAAGSTVHVETTVVRNNGRRDEPVLIASHTSGVHCGTEPSGQLLLNSRVLTTQCLLEATGHTIETCVGSAPVDGCRVEMEGVSYTSNVATHTAGLDFFGDSKTCSLGIYRSNFTGNGAPDVSYNKATVSPRVSHACTPDLAWIPDIHVCPASCLCCMTRAGAEGREEPCPTSHIFVAVYH